jgi:hypothetical protein
VAEFEITACQPTRLFAIRNTSGPFELDRTYSFSEAGGKTRITFSFRMRPHRFPITLLFQLMQSTIAKQVRANIERLPELLEQA